MQFLAEIFINKIIIALRYARKNQNKKTLIKL